MPFKFKVDQPSCLGKGTCLTNHAPIMPRIDRRQKGHKLNFS